jgi:hypothetical protein
MRSRPLTRRLIAKFPRDGAPAARLPAAGRLPAAARLPSRARPTPSRACHLRHRQVPRPVTYAIDMPYRCRWRSRQVPFRVDGVADSLRSAQHLRPRRQTSTHRPHRHHAQHAGRTHGSSWRLRVAERPQVHTLTPAAGKRGPQRHTITVIGYRASRRCRLVARPPAARSSTTYQITQLTGKNSPLSHAKRQPWPRRRAPKAVSEPAASQTGDASSSVQMPAAITSQHYPARPRSAAPRIVLDCTGITSGVAIRGNH